MFSNEELRIGRKRSARLRRLSGYLMMFAGLITAAFLLGCVIILLLPGGLRSGMWLAPLGVAMIVFLLGTWCEAISQSVADTYELVEDVHHTLRKQYEVNNT